MSRRPAPALAILAAFLAAALAPGAASAFTDIFFDDLPEGYQDIIASCAELDDCGALDRLNIGPQYFVLKVWGREIGNGLLVETVGDALIVDAGQLELMIADYYLWPRGVPRMGRVDLRELPGLDVVREGGLVIALEPHEDFAPKLDLGGYRRVRPEEFDTPGRALFAQLNASVSSRFDRHGGLSRDPRGRFGAIFGAQWGLWQLRSQGWLDTDDHRLRFGYGYLDRPILSKAMRFRSGYMPVLPGCSRCVSGRMLGVTIASDSLGGLLYRPADTAFLDIDVEGDVDEIEIFVNGRTVRRETVFPGRHSLAVTALEDGPNTIEVFGINRSTGARRLLVATTEMASTGVLGESIAESRLQLGWAIPDTSLFLDERPELGSPFIQFEQTRGLGHGRELDVALALAREGVVGEAGLNFRLGDGRASLRAIGSYGDAVAGGGVGLRVSQRFQRFSVALRGDVCFDCFSAGAFAVREGLSARAGGSISTRLFGWSASAAVSYNTADRDRLAWQASLRRNVLGGRLSLYAHDTLALRGRDEPAPRRGREFGFSFSRTFGGARTRSMTVGMENVGDRVAARATYRDRPRGGDGFSLRASIDGADLRSIDTRTPTVSAGISYQDRMVRTGINAAAQDGATAVDADVSTGFVLADGQFVLSRSAMGGGVFASGLLPGSPIFVDDRRHGEANPLGQAHLRGLPRGRPGRVQVDEGLRDFGGVSAREASLLAVPGAFYGIGERFRRIERSYRLLVGEDREAVSPGLLLRNEEGDIVGYSGYDGLVTLTGRPGDFVFEEPERICRGRFTGDEPVSGDLPVLHATCESAG